MGPFPLFLAYCCAPALMSEHPQGVLDHLTPNPMLRAVYIPEATEGPIPGYLLRPGPAPAGAYSTPVFADDFGGPMFPTPRILFSSHPGADAAALILALDPGARIESPWPHLPRISLATLSVLDGVEVLRIAAELSRHDSIRFAEPDMVFTGRASVIPNDPLFPECWALHNKGWNGDGLPGFDMKAPRAWDITTGDPSIITVVIDTGVDYDHPDLNLAPGFDATGQNGGGNPVNNCDNHGTPVAGCISAIIDNEVGIVGIAPRTRSASARTFISSLACNGSWSTQASWTVATLNWSLSIGARVTNNSNGYGFQSAAIADAYAATRSAGIVHFASAGNNGNTNISYPANLPTVNAVAALAHTGGRAAFSNFGPGLAISAPGRWIVSTDRVGPLGYSTSGEFADYAVVSGTSFASPFTAGAAALVLSLYPFLSAPRVEEILFLSATDLGPPGYDTDFGWGMVNARLALLLACPADFNLDGTIDFFDYLDFVQAFSDESPAADFNNDGQVDFFDYLDFIAAFSQGCG